MENYYDILVVGGGPGGSFAAQNAAKRGVKVLQVERNPAFGYFQRCAEGVWQQQLHLYMEPREDFVRARIHNLRIHSPNGEYIELNRPNSGYILNRQKFDRFLAENAAKSGVEQWLSSKVEGIRRKGKDSVVVDVNRAGKTETIVSRMVIGADGIESRVGKMLGINTTLDMESVGPCCQSIVEDDAILDDTVIFFSGNKIAPKGYGWVFPRGKGNANFGITTTGDAANKEMLRNLLLSLIKQIYPKARIKQPVCGGIPIYKKGLKIAADNLILVGDAARQANPLTGAGILEALRAGVIAGDTIYDALARNDFSHSVLKGYQKAWQDFLGRKHAKFYRIRRAIDRIKDNTFDDTVRALNKMETDRLEIREIFTTLLLKKPSLFLEIRHLF